PIGQADAEVGLVEELSQLIADEIHDALEADRAGNTPVDLLDEGQGACARGLRTLGGRLHGLRRHRRRLLRRSLSWRRLLRGGLAGSHAQSASFTTSPARTMTGSFLPSDARRLMSFSGSPSTTSRSAWAPGLTHPSLPSIIMSSAPMDVACRSSSSGVNTS